MGHLSLFGLGQIGLSLFPLCSLMVLEVRVCVKGRTLAFQLDALTCKFGHIVPSPFYFPLSTKENLITAQSSIFCNTRGDC